MIAGPTDIVVLADEHADPEYVAADLLAQAEHDEMSPSILVTPSRELAEAVRLELWRQLDVLPKKAIASVSTATKGAILLVDSLDEGVDVVNRLAPEHCELLVQEPFNLLPRIENAGAIFLGAYSTEPVGDYFAGPNHVLPTNGTARFSSPLNVDDFLKKSSVIHYSKEALIANGEMIMTLARNEGLGRSCESGRDTTQEGREVEIMAEQDKGIARSASVARKTNETDIELAFQVDGTGISEIQTDVPFLNHMLDLFTKHGQFDLKVDAKGDIEIDDHHTVEDIGICLRSNAYVKRLVIKEESNVMPVCLYRWMKRWLKSLSISATVRILNIVQSILRHMWAALNAACSRIPVEVCAGSSYYAACYRSLRAEHASHD